MIFEPDAEGLAYEQAARERAEGLRMEYREYRFWRAHVKRTYLQMLAFERTRHVVDPRMVAVLAGAAS